MTTYGNVAAFKAYHLARGKSISVSWTDDMINAALLLCSDWLDNQYGDLWSGFPTGGFTQGRLWPRTNAGTNTYPQYIFTTSEIPANIDNAVYEVAFRELTTPGSVQKDYTPNKYNKVSVNGAISVEYNASVIQSSDLQLQIPIVESLMKPLINPSAQGSFSLYSGGSERV